jgi:hypothetical protein
VTLFPDIDAEEALEDELQKAAVAFLYRLEQLGLLSFSHSVNEGKRTEQEREKLFDMGMRPGQPDLEIYLNGGCTVFIELKTKTGWVFPAQKIRHALLRLLGFDVHVVKAKTPGECVHQLATILQNHYGIVEGR